MDSIYSQAHDLGRDKTSESVTGLNLMFAYI